MIDFASAASGTYAANPAKLTANGKPPIHDSGPFGDWQRLLGRDGFRDFMYLEACYHGDYTPAALQLVIITW